MAIKLGEMLLRANIISDDQLSKALEQQRLHGGKLGYNLVKLGYVKEDDITSLLSQQYGVPAIKLSHFEIDAAIIKLIPAEIARKYQIVPLNRAGSTLTIAMGDPTNVFAMDDIKFITGYNVEPVVASEIAIMEAIDHYYGSSHALELKKVMENIASTEDTDLTVMEEEDGTIENLQELEASTEDAPVVKLVNLMFSDALKRKASDIHIEPYEKVFRVRFRIDGILHEVMNPPLKLKDAITSRIKILAKLDISEKRLPQDGRIKMKMKIMGKMKEVDVRVSVIPALFGEKVVMRLLDKDYLMLDMTKLGFEMESLERFKKAIQRPYGMILVTGPTGSGKTNTLYSAISAINNAEVNITTAEDPVEFNIAGVNQVQMKDAIGLNFAAALRSYLRQDPNIILVGEIRDFETAEIAVKAALTGHLVFSTVHTNDAPSTINRLMNMGIEPFLVSTSVHMIVAQRLIRRICVACKDEAKVPPQTLIDIGFDPEEVSRIKVMKGKGCPDCGMSGYKGRIALYEVMDVTDAIREMILMGASAHELKKQAIEDGMLTLRGSGLRKLRDGVCTIDEVLRETVL
ncbi:MAG: type IV-A pilus assembly ATPase PilB [Acidobacteriota bacterium]